MLVLLLRGSLLEIVGAEPDLLDVGLVRVVRQNLLDSVDFLRLLVLAEPDQSESSAPEQLLFLEVVGKPISELVPLLIAFFCIKGKELVKWARLWGGRAENSLVRPR